MPYNTRRKSLSLPSLGIHVPTTHAARAAAAAAAAAGRSSQSSSTASPRSPAVSTMAAPPKSSSPSRHDAQAAKKLKRSISDSEDSDGPHPSEPRPKRRDGPMKLENTPPPSPPADPMSVDMSDAEMPPPPSKTIDLSGIDDDIVKAAVMQLQTTGNRPHLVKELAAVLMQRLKIVQQSANPCAIISSRLSTYLKRSCWSASAPCPLAKELETVHPRRTYFYLTTCPHQPLPDPAHAATLSQLAHTRTIITPSLSSVVLGSDDSEERRRELSPSPEVDLSSPDFDDMDDDLVMPSTPIGSLSVCGLAAAATRLGGHHHHHHPHGAGGARHQRAASPPLEKDEKEFTQTADGLQKRKQSGSMLTAPSPHEQAATSIELDFGGRDDSGLFGDKVLPSAINLGGVPTMTFVSSPAMRPALMPLNLGKKDGEADGWAKLDQMLEWDRSPESIDIEELDGLLHDY